MNIPRACFWRNSETACYSINVDNTFTEMLTCKENHPMEWMCGTHLKSSNDSRPPSLLHTLLADLNNNEPSSVLLHMRCALSSNSSQLVNRRQFVDILHYYIIAQGFCCTFVLNVIRGNPFEHWQAIPHYSRLSLY